METAMDRSIQKDSLVTKNTKVLMKLVGLEGTK